MTGERLWKAVQFVDHIKEGRPPGVGKKRWRVAEGRDGDLWPGTPYAHCSPTTAPASRGMGGGRGWRSGMNRSFPTDSIPVPVPASPAECGASTFPLSGSSERSRPQANWWGKWKKWPQVGVSINPFPTIPSPHSPVPLLPQPPVTLPAHFPATTALVTHPGPPVATERLDRGAGQRSSHALCRCTKEDPLLSTRRRPGFADREECSPPQRPTPFCPADGGCGWRWEPMAAVPRKGNGAEGGQTRASIIGGDRGGRCCLVNSQ